LKQFTAQQIADKTGGRLIGPPHLVVRGVAALSDAGEQDLSFLGNCKYQNQVMTSGAVVVLVPEKFDEPPPPARAWIVCGDPSDAFSVVTAEFAPPPVIPPPGIHPSAVVEPPSSIASSAHIGACAVIAAGVTIGENSIVEAGCFVGAETTIGRDSRLHPNVTVKERCVLGDRVIVHSGTVIGSDGFGYIPGAEGHKKIPQTGTVQIDDDVEIHANVAIDRGRFGRTWIKSGVKIDNLVQIAHNVVIGEHSFVVAQVGIAGSTEIGKGVALAGQAGVAGHVKIGDGAKVLGQTGVWYDVEPGALVMGSPAVSRIEFLRFYALLRRLPELFKKVDKLAKGK